MCVLSSTCTNTPYIHHTHTLISVCVCVCVCVVCVCVPVGVRVCVCLCMCYLVLDIILKNASADFGHYFPHNYLITAIILFHCFKTSMTISKINTKSGTNGILPHRLKRGITLD